jgi:hypothetical protein
LPATGYVLRAALHAEHRWKLLWVPDLPERGGPTSDMHCRSVPEQWRLRRMLIR